MDCYAPPHKAALRRLLEPTQGGSIHGAQSRRPRRWRGRRRGRVAGSEGAEGDRQGAATQQVDHPVAVHGRPSCPRLVSHGRRSPAKVPGGLAGSGVACGGHRGRYPRRPLRPGGVQRRTHNRNTLRAPVAQWIEQRFPKSGGGVRGRASRALRVFGAGADRSQTSALIRARPHVVGVRVGVNWDAAAGAWSSRRARLRAAASGARATTPNDPGQRPVGQTLHS